MTAPSSPSGPAPAVAADDAHRPLLVVDHVTRAFGTVVALDDVSFEIRENEFFALLGPSGCGKTTLLRILAGLDEPDTGRITLDGDDLVSMPAHRRPINLMFQSYALFPHLDVRKNVAYGLEREKLPKDVIAERVTEALTTVGLEGMDKRKPSQLSGGQRQRVALARAMVKRPRVLLLDEPLAALDRKIREQMQVELKRLQHEVGITFVVVTHDQEEAMSMADRIAVLDRGRVEQIASPTELYERPASRFVADFIGSTNMFDGVVAADRTMLVLPSGRTIAAPVGDDDPGTTLSFALRPEKVTVGGATPDAIEGTSGGSPMSRFDGTVRDVHFYGGLSHTIVDVDGFDAPLVASSVGGSSHRRDDAVVIAWSADDMVQVRR
jgi:spermidine/putrescine transport system ATP-binding protein/putrescine transport system ATP-binding protein